MGPTNVRLSEHTQRGRQALDYPTRLAGIVEASGCANKLDRWTIKFVVGGSLW